MRNKLSNNKTKMILMVRIIKKRKIKSQKKPKKKNINYKDKSMKTFLMKQLKLNKYKINNRKLSIELSSKNLINFLFYLPGRFYKISVFSIIL